MWKQSIDGITKANLESLEYYQTRGSQQTSKDICSFVRYGIGNLPIFFSFPLKIYGTSFSFFCLLTNGKLPQSLNAKERQKMLSRARFFPLFGTLNKLIRAMSFLRLFDKIPLNEDNYPGIIPINKEHKKQ